jgi:hypothetical protein
MRLQIQEHACHAASATPPQPNERPRGCISSRCSTLQEYENTRAAYPYPYPYTCLHPYPYPYAADAALPKKQCTWAAARTAECSPSKNRTTEDTLSKLSMFNHQSCTPGPSRWGCCRGRQRAVGRRRITAGEGRHRARRVHVQTPGGAISGQQEASRLPHRALPVCLSIPSATPLCPSTAPHLP